MIWDPRFRRWIIGLSLGLGYLLALRLLTSDPWFADGTVPHAGYYDTFFTQQALAILQGRLDVDPTVLPGECFTFQGKCFGYFGITPSLLRLPFIATVPLFAAAPTLGLSPLMTLLGVGLGITASVFLVDYLWRISSLGSDTRKHSNWIRTNYAVALLSVGPGTLFLQLTRPAVFEEAIVWAAALSLWAIFFLVRWIHHGGSGNVLTSVALFTLGASARGSAGVLSLSLAFTLLLLLLAQRKRASISTYAWLALLAFVPIGSVAGGFYAKFRTVAPSWLLNEQIASSQHWATILEINGGRTFSPTFAPTTLFTYLRPDALGLRPDTSTLFGSLQLELIRPAREDIEWLWPLEPGSLYVEPVASLTVLIPLAILMLFLVLLWSAHLKVNSNSPFLAKSSETPLWLGRLLVASGFSYALLVITTVGVTNRYLGDFIPGIVLAIALGSLAVGSKLPSRPRMAQMIIFASILLLLAGILTNTVTAHTQLITRLAQAAPL